MRIPFLQKKSSDEADESLQVLANELVVMSSQSLLHPHQRVLQEIKRNTSVTDKVFNSHYQHALSVAAEFSQQFSASVNHHHSQKGGMLIHLLDVALRTIKISRGYILPPGGAPEEINSNEERWRYGVFIVALAHDLGKLIADIETVYRTQEESSYTIWQPWHGPMPVGAKYQYRHPPKNGSSYKGLHEQLSVTLLPYLITSSGSQWIRDDHALLSQMMATLSGMGKGGVVIEEILKKADHGSTGDSLNKMTGLSNDEPLTDKPMHLKIIESLKHLLTHGDVKKNHPGATVWITRDITWIVSKPGSEKLRENMAAEGISPLPMSAKRLIDILGEHNYLFQHPEGGYQWQCVIKTEASNAKPWQQKLTCFGIDNREIWVNGLPAILNGSVTPCSHSGEPLESESPDDNGGEHYLLEKPVSFKKQVETEEQISNEPPPLKQSELDTEEPAKCSPQTSDRLSLQSPVIAWAMNSIKYRKIKINEAQAPVHIVDGKVCFVTPALFHLYLKDNKREALVLGDSQEERLKGVQKKVRSLNLHIRHHSGHDFMTVKVNGDRIQSTFEAICYERHLLPELEAFCNNPILSISDR